jgi:hypothetical protein
MEILFLKYFDAINAQNKDFSSAVRKTDTNGRSTTVFELNNLQSFSSATDHQIIYYCAIILSNQLPDLI